MELEITLCVAKAFDPRLIVAWPSAKMAVMEANKLQKLLLQIEKSSLKKQGQKIDKTKKKNYLKLLLTDTTDKPHPTMPRQDFGLMLS